MYDPLECYKSHKYYDGHFSKKSHHIECKIKMDKKFEYFKNLQTPFLITGFYMNGVLHAATSVTNFNPKTGLVTIQVGAVTNEIFYKDIDGFQFP